MIFSNDLWVYPVLIRDEWGVKMSRYEHQDYHAARAQEELLRAREASDPAVAQVHRTLAALHKRKLMTIVDGEAPDAGLAFDPQI